MHDYNYYTSERPEILELVPNTARQVLDVGCGGGWLGSAIKQRQSASVTGIEIVSSVAQKAATKLDKVWNAPIEEVLPVLPENYFDCIVMADVLEHLVDPWRTLVQLAGKLMAGGTFVISLPNARHWSIIFNLLEGEWQYEVEGILDRTHLRFFTLQTMKDMIWNAGLKITVIGQTTISWMNALQDVPRLNSLGINPQKLLEQSDVFQYLFQATKPQEVVAPKVAIIVLNWNGGQDTAECLDSLFKCQYPNYEIIVVDNYSSDGSAQRLEKEFPKATFILNDANLGYAGGNNVGMRYALSKGAEFILVLNNDTTVDQNFLAELIKATQVVDNVAAVVPLIYFHSEPKKIWYAGTRFSRQHLDFIMPYHGLIHEEGGGAFSSLTTTEIAIGAAIMFRASALRSVGLFDERFFLMHEESDWSYRARKLGLTALLVPKAKIWHKVSVSFGGAGSPLMNYFSTRNLLLFAEKHLSKTECRGIRRRLLSYVLNPIKSALSVLMLGSTSAPGLLSAISWRLSTFTRTIGKLKADPQFKAHFLGLIHYYLRRFGDCPQIVREWNAANKNKKSQPPI